MATDSNTARLIDGRALAANLRTEIASGVAKLKAETGVTPGLAVVLVGENPASVSYVTAKEKACREAGMYSKEVRLPESTTEEELVRLVRELNVDPSIHGILVQLPLPKHISDKAVIDAIEPAKDVDGFTTVNVGRMLIGKPGFLPATPAGVQQMLVRSGVETAGKHVVIVGRSNIVGKPMAALMVQRGFGADSTVTVVHSKTRDLPSITRQADILIVAIGKPRFVTADMVKEGAVVIDVGTNRIDDPTHPKGSRLVGDVDFDNVKDKVSAITPVPGGVGPMTICMLMANAVKAAEDAAKSR